MLAVGFSYTIWFLYFLKRYQCYHLILFYLSIIKLRNSGVGFRGGMSRTHNLFPRITNLWRIFLVSDPTEIFYPHFSAVLKITRDHCKCRQNQWFFNQPLRSLSAAFPTTYQTLSTVSSPGSHIFVVLLPLWVLFQLSWFLFLLLRYQCVYPLRSCFWSPLFSPFVVSLRGLIGRHGFSHHWCAVDAQICLSS